MAEGSGGGGVLREILASFGFAVDDHELKKGENRLGRLLEKVKQVAEGVVAAFAVEQVYSFVESQAAAMNAIERTSSMLGMSTERVQEYQFAAKSLGLDINAVTDSISRMQVAQQMAAQGGKEQAQAFKWVGASVKDANGHMKDSDTLFLDVADGISKMVDPAKQAAAAQYIFGRSGRALLPFLKEGRKGVEEYFQVYRELGGGYDKEAIEKGREFDKQSARTNLTLTALKNTIAKAVLPIVTAIGRAFEKTVKWLNEVTKHTHIVQATMIAFGAAALVFVAPLIAAAVPVLLLAAGIVALILALEDLYGFLTGKQSATGEILDKIFGKGAQVKILQQVKDTWAQMKDVFKDALPYIEKIVAAMKWVIEHGKEFSHWVGNKLAGEVKEGDNLGERSKIPLTDEQRAYVHQKATMARELSYKAGVSLPAGSFGPLNSPEGATIILNQQIHAAEGMDEKKLGEHAAHSAAKAMKQAHREAMATLPRAGN